MKNIFKSILASMLLMTSCATDTELEVAPTAQSNKFYASIEAPVTRTYADKDGKLLWNANDEITLFQGNAYPRQFQFKGETGKNYGEFEEINPPSGVISANPLEANYAIYPYAANTTISNQGQISYTIPAVQSYAKDSFGLGANPMVAVTKNTTDNFLAFKNLCGYFEFSLFGDITVKSIEFKGNNNEKLAGAVTITATNQDDPTFVFADGATETITLDCGDGVELGADAANATKFWFVVPATTYAEGITITIADTEGKKMTKSTSKSITIERSTVQPLNAFEVETNIPNNQIWYTSTDGNIVTPNNLEAFGATIKSNTYENGVGIITFKNNISKLGNNAFENCTTLLDIDIPASVTTIGNKVFYNCTSLRSINIPSSITKIGDEVFCFCRGLIKIVIPNSVTEIGVDTFYNCLSLNSVTLPNQLTAISNGMFYGCDSMPNIEIPLGVKSIGENAFLGCDLLTIIPIPEGVTEIGRGAFWNCTALKELTIPIGVTAIKSDTFTNCSNLKIINCKPTTPPTLNNTALKNLPSNFTINVPSESLNAYQTAAGWVTYKSKIVGVTFE